MMFGDVAVPAEHTGLGVRKGVVRTGQSRDLALSLHHDGVGQEVDLAGHRCGGDVAGPVISSDPPDLPETAVRAGLTDGLRVASDVS